MREEYLLALTAGLAFFSSVLWLIAACVTRAPSTKPSDDGWFEASISDSKGKDVVKTLELQSIFNKWAAFFSGLTALSQIASTINSWPKQ